MIATISRVSVLVCFVLGAFACKTTPKDSPLHGDPTQSAGPVQVRKISNKDALVSLGKVSQGEYRIHLVDVGTGLAVLVQGADFNLLFDGGSGDDMRGMSKGMNNNRLMAYLWAALGESGPQECIPQGDKWPAWGGGAERPIDHVFLSHPHLDHGSLLRTVFDCYDVNNFWAGVTNDTAFYEELWSGVAQEKNNKIHSAVPAPTANKVTVRSKTIDMAADRVWTTFKEGQTVSLGAGAKFTILHSNGEKHNDYNQNSTVILVELGGTRLLLTGDAESGPRLPPSAPVGHIEKHLIDTHKDKIKADILQVGHHGSMTSSRMEFLNAVKPKYALVSAGPKKYGSVVLPDKEVIDVLNEVGAKILRTDENDAKCPDADKFGTNDDRPGGCDNHVLIIRNTAMQQQGQ